jgi:hypothetical protein
LASTAKKHGYTSPKGKNTSKPKASVQGRPTYTVATKEWAILADFIAGKTPPIDVPIRLATLLNLTIDLRQSFSEKVSETLEDSIAKRDSDVKHDYFLSILKKVRDTLKPHLLKERMQPAKPQSTAEIINLFDHLELEEPSEDFELAPDATPLPANEPVYKAERPNDIEETFFAFHLLLHDLARLRTEVSIAWAGYRNGSYDLVAAAITTNTAVDLARSMIDELKVSFVKLGGAHRMLQLYYMSQYLAAGTSDAHKVLPGDDINFKMYAVAESLFWPASQMLVAFCNALKVMPNPEMKRGIYGVYEPQSNRKSKSDREKFIEDKVLLLEVLEEIYYYGTGCVPTARRR